MQFGAPDSDFSSITDQPSDLEQVILLPEPSGTHLKNGQGGLNYLQDPFHSWHPLCLP